MQLKRIHSKMKEFKKNSFNFKLKKKCKEYSYHLKIEYFKRKKH